MKADWKQLSSDDISAESLGRLPEDTVNCRTLKTCSPCTAVHTTARPAKIIVGIPKEI